ncbi:MAG: NAD(P)-dependent oxidoreductase [Anaerolineae bacterium]
MARAILISSSGCFANQRPARSTKPPPTPLGLHAVAKSATEALAETLRAEFGRDVAAIRLSSIYGPGELPRPTRPRVSPIGRMVAQALETGVVRVYRDDPARDWTYAPDVGRAVVTLVSVPVLNHALYNVASGHVRTPLEVAETIASALGGIRVMALDGADPAAPPLTRLGVLTHARLTADTGFSDWTPFEEGIAATAAWARAQMEPVS